MGCTIAVSVGMRIAWLILSLQLLLADASLFARTGNADSDDENPQVKFSPDAAATFNGRCTACHTYGRGIKVGPDLKGVTERRKRAWLLEFIHGSSGVIKSGDPTATALFAQFKQQRMPDWVDLSEKQINDILDYLAIGGPDIKPADERNAATATAAEIENGRKIFYGEMQTRFDAQACITCHGVRGAGVRGGSLGPDLSSMYLRYQDPELTLFLRHRCFNWQTKTPKLGYLTAKESFAVKAFLRASAMPARPNLSAVGNPSQSKEAAHHAR